MKKFNLVATLPRLDSINLERDSERRDKERESERSQTRDQTVYACMVYTVSLFRGSG